MNRRQSRSVRRGFISNTTRLFDRLLHASSGMGVYSAENITPGDTGKASAMVDWLNSSRTLAQATGANQPTIVTADPANGQAALEFSAASSTRLVSNQAASFWAALHGASPSFWAAVWTPLTAVNGEFPFLMVTKAGSTIALGLTAYVSNNATNSFVNYSVGNGTSAVVSPGTPALDTPAVSSGVRVLSASFTGGNSPSPYVVRGKGAVVQSGNSAANASASAPGVTLKFGCNSAESTFASFRLQFLFFAPTQPHELAQYVFAKYRGVVA